MAENCEWFMVPPGLAGQALNALTNPGAPFDIATPKYACGSAANALRAKGMQGYATKQAAVNASDSANKDANPVGDASIPNPEAFLSRLSNRNTWIRVAEGALGGVLIIIAALAALKNTDVGSAATTVAKVVPK